MGFLGVRVIKTAVASVIAAFTAVQLGLDLPYSAALLAVLGVDVTKKRSLTNAAHRVIASVVGLFIGSLLFQLLGFELWVFGLFILVAYPLLARAHLKDGIVTSSVVVLHVFSLREVGLDRVLNEVGLLFVGLGTATLINLLYMPSAEKSLLQARTDTESSFSEIFVRIARVLQQPEELWDGKEMLRAGDAVSVGEELAQKASENALFRGDEGGWGVYFTMRRRQLESIEHMIHLVSQVYESLPQSELTAEVFLQLSEDVKQEYYAGQAQHSLKQLEASFREMALPATRDEFEIRSAVLQLCLEMERYLAVAEKNKKRRAEA